MLFVIIIHVIACIGLIALVLIQRGRGSGLVETFSGVESMFGTKTSVFLTRATTILSTLFFITCLSLAVLSVRQSRSLLKDAKPQALPAQTPAPQAQAVPLAEPAKETATPTAQPPAVEKPQEAPKTE